LNYAGIFRELKCFGVRKEIAGVPFGVVNARSASLSVGNYQP
jgi:hypothetical protein